MISYAIFRRVIRALCVLMSTALVLDAQGAYAQTPTDAISREVSLYNDLSPDAPTDAISREVSIYNNLTPPIDMPTDAISREVSLYNMAFAAEPTDAVSREVSIYNQSIPESQVLDAISRELSVQAVIHCTGDFNGDFDVTTADISAFAQVLTGADTHPARRDAADVNCDGSANGNDIQPFVDAILMP